MQWDICTYLHAMSDVGFASPERQEKGCTYSKPRTYNAECYATKCHRRGVCIRRVSDEGCRLNSKTALSQRGEGKLIVQEILEYYGIKVLMQNSNF